MSVLLASAIGARLTTLLAKPRSQESDWRCSYFYSKYIFHPHNIGSCFVLLAQHSLQCVSESYRDTLTAILYVVMGYPQCNTHGDVVVSATSQSTGYPTLDVFVSGAGCTSLKSSDRNKLLHCNHRLDHKIMLKITTVGKQVTGRFVQLSTFL